MGEKEPRRAVPPNLIPDELSPINHAWYLTQLGKGNPAERRHAEAIAVQSGFIRDEFGSFIVPTEIKIEEVE